MKSLLLSTSFFVLVDPEFLDSIVQCFINLLQSSITELVYFIEPRDHLNPVSISKNDCPWRVFDGEIMLELKSNGLLSRFGEVQLRLVTLNSQLEVFYMLSDNQVSGP
ncbi:hypothetical protein Tco_0297913 [Tanacetum coccineum]